MTLLGETRFSICKKDLEKNPDTFAVGNYDTSLVQMMESSVRGILVSRAGRERWILERMVATSFLSVSLITLCGGLRLRSSFHVSS